MLRDLFSLFPAYAGVIPDYVGYKLAKFAFPRIRGGDPFGGAKKNAVTIFSPHTRG